jgi:hypothetical protein
MSDPVYELASPVAPGHNAAMATLTAFLFWVLLSAAGGKALRGAGLSLGERLALGAEGVIAAMLLLPAWRSLALGAASLLWLAYAAYLLRAWQRDASGPCPCGDWTPLKLGPLVIGRALVLAALAAFAAVPGEAMPLGPALLPGLGWALGYLLMLALAAMVQTRWDLEQEGRNG